MQPTACASRYTGKERDPESGLDEFGARYYASMTERFTSPDPGWLLQSKLSNPQTLNQYAYVLNNPLIFTDPDGLTCAWYDGGDSGQANELPRGQIPYRHGDANGCWNEGGVWSQDSSEPDKAQQQNGSGWTSVQPTSGDYVTVSDYSRSAGGFCSVLRKPGWKTIYECIPALTVSGSSFLSVPLDHIRSGCCDSEGNQRPNNKCWAIQLDLP